MELGNGIHLMWYYLVLLKFRDSVSKQCWIKLKALTMYVIIYENYEEDDPYEY